MKKGLASLSFIIGLIGSGVVNAELGMFSRANCLGGFNESVSWDPILTWKLATESVQSHQVTGEYREFVAEEAVTGRSYAGCQFCGTEWYVEGYHWAATQDREIQNIHLMEEVCESGWTPQSISHFYPCKLTEATSCNLTEW